MGSLISENAAERVEKQVCHAVRQGAVLLCGGGRTGAFYMPAVLDHITGKMDIARHMVIDGPVWPVIGFDTAEDAMVMARFEEKKSRINYEWRMGERNHVGYGNRQNLLMVSTNFRTAYVLIR